MPVKIQHQQFITHMMHGVVMLRHQVRVMLNRKMRRRRDCTFGQALKKPQEVAFKSNVSGVWQVLMNLDHLHVRYSLLQYLHW